MFSYFSDISAFFDPGAETYLVLIGLIALVFPILQPIRSRTYQSHPYAEYGTGTMLFPWKAIRAVSIHGMIIVVATLVSIVAGGGSSSILRGGLLFITLIAVLSLTGYILVTVLRATRESPPNR